MIFGGLQKISLIDYPTKVSSVVFTQGCLFRCPYCHNPELIEIKKQGAIDEKEILEHLEKKRNFLEGVCITGGETTIHKDLPEFIARVKALGLLVKLDTNGINPDMVQMLIDKRLVDYFAMDVKHVWERYDEVAHVGNQKAIDNCQRTFSLIQNSGIDHEFRTTVFPPVHQEHDFFTIAGYLQAGEKYFIQNIQYIKNFDSKIDRSKSINVGKIIKALRVAYPALIVNER